MKLTRALRLRRVWKLLWAVAFGLCVIAGGCTSSSTAEAPPPVSLAQSTVFVNPPEPVAADGVTPVSVRVTLLSDQGVPVPGQEVLLSVRGKDVQIEQPPRTAADGMTVGRLRTTLSQVVAVTVFLRQGEDLVTLAQEVPVTFIPVPSLLAPAVYLDTDPDGRIGSGDQLRLDFSQPVSAGPPGDVFLLPVSGDSLGEGWELRSGPGPNQITVVLGAAAHLTTPGLFSSARLQPGSPSGIQIAQGTAAIVSTLTGAPTGPASPVDIAPGFVFRWQDTLPFEVVSVALADFDLDGDLDLLEGRQEVPGAVRLNDGSGFFFRELDFGSASARGEALVVGDLDGDGTPDIVTAGAGGLAVFFNRELLFNEAVVLQLPVAAVAGGDLQNDGDTDLVAGTPEGLFLLFNQGDGTFGEPLSLSPAPAYNVLLGDWDADGDLDVLANTAEGVWIRRNQGDGTFSAAAQSLGTFVAQSMVTGDIDADGDQDLIFGEAHQLRLFANAGDGTFTLLRQQVEPERKVLALFDYDTDSDLDLVLAMNGSLPGRVWMNDGAGNFPAKLTFGAEPNPDRVNAVAIGDIDGDGDLDIVTAADGASRIFLNSVAGAGSERR